MKKKHKEVLENRANATGEVQEHFGCDYCGDPLLFHMKDNFHDFSIGVTTILQCLSIAEQKGVVPELPRDWFRIDRKIQSVIM